MSRRVVALAGAVALLGALAALLAGPAQAYENVTPGFNFFKATPSTSQAGGHPDVEIDFEYRVDNEIECTVGCLAGRRVGIHWPEGFIGNPHVAPKCSLSEFNTARCASDSQIGKFTLSIGELEIYVPIYNMETRPDQAGLLGFTTPLITFPVFLELTGRTDSDYGLDAISTPQLRLPFTHFRVTLWGVPADAKNDVDRFYTPLTGTGACYVGQTVPGCPPGGEAHLSPTYAPATVPPAPFLQNPTTCGVPLTLTGDIEYYGGTFGHVDVPWPSTTGCNQASFTPSVTAKPTTSWADAPTGLDAKLRVPQTQSPITPAPSELKASRVTLPEGFSINPGAADGKVACSDSLSSIGTLLAATCPEYSKVGTLMLDIAALPEPIPGALFLAEPKPGEPYRVLLTASGFATNVKLLGRVDTDPATGQISMVFPSLPQSPLQEFDLHLFGSERGLLATPSHCGTYFVESEFVPWNTALATRTTRSSITIDAGPNGTPCPSGARNFRPDLDAGVAEKAAGKHSPFSLLLRRVDGEQNLAGVNVKSPPGFTASLRGIPYCPEAAIASLTTGGGRTGNAELASPACPAASLVGQATAGAGAGTHPLYVSGRVYLAGPYKGAPLSLLVVVPAVTGPYDLGNAAVRVAVRVDPANAQVSAISDPLPQILQGVPLRTRSVLITLDRPNFTINPTNCARLAVDHAALGTEGGASSGSRHFQVANCSELPFEPALSLRLTGGVQRRGHPAITATYRQQPGEANARRISVALPRGQLLENKHIGAICTRVDFAKDSCPEASVYGSAEAMTPLLDRPLKGDVYLRSSSNKLPDLVMDLEGQIDIELAGRIDTAKGGSLRTNFEAVPDAPVTSFLLRLQGGKKGLVVNQSSLCGKARFATTKMAGQNGVRFNTRTRLQAACGSKARKNQRRTGKSGEGVR